MLPRDPSDETAYEETATTVPAYRSLRTAIERWGGPESGSPDDIFSEFVARANREWVASVEAVLSDSDLDPIVGDDERTDPAIVAPENEQAEHEEAEKVVLLTSPKARDPSSQPARFGAPRLPSRRATALPVEEMRPPVLADAGGAVRTEPAWTSVVPERSETTQRREAARLVPDVSAVQPAPAPPVEGSEDGLVPSGELDRKLADMDVLLRYGHAAQVQSEFEALRLKYPRDLLLLRRIAEFYVAHGMRRQALDVLFELASGLFERRNIEGMRAALEQVRVLDPENRRASRLLALLDQRPSPVPPRR